jgi:hypothetical protein
LHEAAPSPVNVKYHFSFVQPFGTDVMIFLKLEKKWPFFVQASANFRKTGI